MSILPRPCFGDPFFELINRMGSTYTGCGNCHFKAACDATVVLSRGSGVRELLLRVYTGSIPADADSPATGTLIAEMSTVAHVSDDATVTFSAATGTVIHPGTVGYARVVSPEGTLAQLTVDIPRQHVAVGDNITLYGMRIIS